MSFAFGTIEKRDAGVRRHSDPVKSRRRSSLTMRNYLSWAKNQSNARRRQLDRAYAQCDIETAERMTFGSVLEEPTDGPVFEGPTLEEINEAPDDYGYWPFIDEPSDSAYGMAFEGHDSACCLTCLEVIPDTSYEVVL